MAQLLKIVACPLTESMLMEGVAEDSTLFNFIKYVLGNMNVYEKSRF